jgi:CMP/dCMP kinase
VTSYVINEVARRPIIAIDGPAGAGKTTTAREVARRLGFIYLDTGSMYRAIALAVLRNQVDLSNPEQIAMIAEGVNISIRYENELQRVYLNDENVTEILRSPEVTKAVTPVCEVPAVRRKLVQLQQELGNKGGMVVEGRDIGSVVFPNAEVKIFLTADLKTRAARRILDLHKAGIQADVEITAADIDYRDKRDSERSDGPLIQAPDAIIIDSSELTLDEQVEAIIEQFKLKCG